MDLRASVWDVLCERVKICARECMCTEVQAPDHERERSFGWYSNPRRIGRSSVFFSATEHGLRH